MTYAKAFFDLQLRFAHRTADLSGRPIACVLLDYTNFYARFGLGRGFDLAHPIWRKYLAGLQHASDPGEWTYRFYLERQESLEAPGVAASHGCFAFAPLDGNRIRLHFRNAETDGRSPLGIDRRGRRLAELAALFEHVRRTAPEPPRVVGASWLYNVDAYRRLFPPAYLASGRVLADRFRHMPLWGQFLDRRGELRERATREFLERLGRLAAFDTLHDCFPLQVLTVEAPAQAFYEFYGLDIPPRDHLAR
ncbi:MAG TPA: hypothetical protein VML54_16630 [Candidatus Limnocylindrales bacterium]|nr:hypothetical protein [Candidatus Limnocylindrales bacterium]